jgi:hypothetical protein
MWGKVGTKEGGRWRHTRTCRGAVYTRARKGQARAKCGAGSWAPEVETLRVENMSKGKRGRDSGLAALTEFSLYIQVFLGFIPDYYIGSPLDYLF